MQNYGKPPIQTPFLDQDGRVSQPWYLFLNNIYISLSSGQSNATLTEVLAIAVQALTQKDPDIQLLGRKIDDLQAMQLQGMKIDLTPLLKRIEELEMQVVQLTQQTSLARVSVQQFNELRDYVFALQAHP